MCKSEQKSRQRRHLGHRVRAISEESEESNDYFEINTVTLTNVNSVKEKHSRHIYASMKIIGKNEKSNLTRFQLDSGATCNIITARTLKELDINQLQKTSQILTMYNNTTIKPIGTCILKLVNPKNNDKFKAEFVVVKDGTLTPLLGSKAVQTMNLVTVNYENIKAVRQGALFKPLSKETVMKEYADIFEGTGKEVAIGTWVASEYQNGWFPGEVTEILSSEALTYRVNFMKPKRLKSNAFVGPSPVDSKVIDSKFVFIHILILYLLLV
ncbi:unnamed protein product [Mytilus edulis]|uniref:Peptidase A2 domain-containing protein n=1 Tax=Mytilus edulis TaxID=6550 RepID=A0A8S3S4S6_MYTED|nr:unnamed protein product [Mytilus edulis]